ncbi:MAG: hypothetical protein COT74_08995 [Bdellovibrionales bacterium CG10_big_fil_rev_8_21_14_0_10_45_34]|nr:MAG: hypothetical protein COT74_08995 [Bdellovibrionales bacterium CG10_big_fil_rev_8_21_14_0_10_45_34]
MAAKKQILVGYVIATLVLSFSLFASPSKHSPKTQRQSICLGLMGDGDQKNASSRIRPKADYVRPSSVDKETLGLLLQLQSRIATKNPDSLAQVMKKGFTENWSPTRTEKEVLSWLGKTVNLTSLWKPLLSSGFDTRSKTQIFRLLQTYQTWLFAENRNEVESSFFYEELREVSVLLQQRLNGAIKSDLFKSNTLPKKNVFLTEIVSKLKGLLPAANKITNWVNEAVEKGTTRNAVDYKDYVLLGTISPLAFQFFYLVELTEAFASNIGRLQYESSPSDDQFDAELESEQILILIDDVVNNLPYIKKTASYANWAKKVMGRYQTSEFAYSVLGVVVDSMELVFFMPSARKLPRWKGQDIPFFGILHPFSIRPIWITDQKQGFDAQEAPPLEVAQHDIAHAELQGHPRIDELKYILQNINSILDWRDFFEMARSHATSLAENSQTQAELYSVGQRVSGQTIADQDKASQPEISSDEFFESLMLVIFFLGHEEPGQDTFSLAKPVDFFRGLGARAIESIHKRTLEENDINSNIEKVRLRAVLQYTKQWIKTATVKFK